MARQIIVGQQYCGPPTSGNGGYVCGLMAGLLEGPVTGILRAPVPLATPLDPAVEEGSVRLLGPFGTLIGEARAADPLLLPTPPPPPVFDAAAEAGRRFPGLTRVFHPLCFTCSDRPAEGVGLRVFTGQIEGAEEGAVAGTWTCHPVFSDANGLAPLEVVWAAMDCPGSVAWLVRGGAGGLLGTMSCEVLRRPAVGEPCVITAWPIEATGRKSIAGVALFSDGKLIARAHQIWIGRPMTAAMPAA